MISRRPYCYHPLYYGRYVPRRFSYYPTYLPYYYPITPPMYANPIPIQEPFTTSQPMQVLDQKPQSVNPLNQLFSDLEIPNATMFSKGMKDDTTVYTVKKDPKTNKFTYTIQD